MVLTEVADKIHNMEIRGAGLIARAAVEALKEHGLGLDSQDYDEFQEEMERAAGILLETRPTAVALPNAVHMVMNAIKKESTLEGAMAVLVTEADAFVENSLMAVERIAVIGARHIPQNATILTHCNSQAALACILEAHRQGRVKEVYATEVRPRNQGLITIRTLNDAGIHVNYIVDSAVRYFINRVDLVIIGADAVAVNGAVVNKIGTSQIALAAHEARTNLMVAAETYKFAPRTIMGELIEIEERPSSEVLSDEIAKTLPNVKIRNPAFDITPPGYIDQIVTEMGAIPPGLAYVIINEFLGWNIDEFQKAFETRR